MTDREYAISKRVDAALQALKDLADFAEGVGRADVRKAAWNLFCKLEEVELEQEG